MTREEHLAAIKAADAAYYNDDAPVMTDSEYDSLRADYIAKYGAAYLDYVPGEAAAAFSKFRHTVPVISLAKVKFDEERGKLETELRRLWPVLHEPKLDGLTVVAYPKADGSCTFVTRGDGKTGEVLPAFIKKYEKSGVNRTGEAVRGEVFMDAAKAKLAMRIKKQPDEFWAEDMAAKERLAKLSEGLLQGIGTL